MKKIVALLTVLIILSCDDGNEDLPEFVFDGNLSVCSSTNGATTTYVFYKTNENEALSVQLSNNDTFLTTEGNQSISSSTVTYRTFSSTITGANYFCQNTPPAAPTLVNEWIGTGDLEISTVFTEDDEDGVDEDSGDTTDTDMDGIPNYLDLDDDGDGILTSQEAFDDNGNLRNTDGDLLPDYLDPDDDGDGTPTLNESITADDDGDEIRNYRDPDDSNSEEARTLTPNSYKEIFESTFTINLLNLENQDDRPIRFDTYNLGNLTVTKTINENDDEGSK